VKKLYIFEKYLDTVFVVFERSFSKVAPCSKKLKKGMKNGRTWATNQKA